MATLANALATVLPVSALVAVKVKPPRLMVCPADRALNVTALVSVRAEYPSDLLIAMLLVKVTAFPSDAPVVNPVKAPVKV